MNSFRFILLAALSAVVLNPLVPFRNACAQNAGDRLKSNANVTIRGRVVDEAGKPVAGAVVFTEQSCQFSERVVTEADANGVFQLNMDSKKLWTLFRFYAMTPDKSRSGAEWLKFITGVAEIPELEIVVKPNKIVTGTVLDEDGKPVEGATVAVLGPGGYFNSVSTDGEGKFKLFDDKESSFPSIYVYKKGVGFDYLGWKEVEKKSGMTSESPPKKLDNLSVQLTLLRGTPVTVKVVNEKGEPLPGVKVIPSRIQEEEIWQWPFIPPKTLESFLDFVGAADSSCGWTNEEGIATITFLPERLITRTRFDADSPEEGVPHPDGRRVYYRGYGGLTMKEMLKDHEMPTITLDEQEQEQEPEWKPVHITGTVKLPDGTPVPWIEVEIRSPGYFNGGPPPCFTDVNGEYEFYASANEVYDFSVARNMIGVAPPVLNFKAGDGKTDARVDFVLKKGIRLHGTVYDVDGKPLADSDRYVKDSLHLYSAYHITVLEKKPGSVPLENPSLDDEEKE
ncbi:MAG: carboxypeptidase-like regulatory domain-containing protein, partial [Planctomycetaceae bacterium]|nr:carboxypeptidase-like regulatory domain-containing protein [Planctomycetaceae bacterium]